MHIVRLNNKTKAIDANVIFETRFFLKTTIPIKILVDPLNRWIVDEEKKRKLIFFIIHYMLMDTKG